MKQILVNYLSILNNSIKENHYIVDIPGDVCNGKTMTGFMTNEPETKYCILRASDNKRTTFEDIISICTNKIETGFLEIEKGRIEENESLKGLKKFIETDKDGAPVIVEKKGKDGKLDSYYKIQHLKYYQDRTMELCDMFSFPHPRFHNLPISDTPSDKESREMIVKVGSVIEGITGGNYSDYSLVIDCTGGDRSSAVMIVALIKMLEGRGFGEIKLLGVNFSYDNTEEKPNKVSEKNDLGDIFDLITGTKVFLKYGDSDVLMDFFKKQNLDEESKETLASIQRFSESIKLCIAGTIKQRLGEMVNRISRQQINTNDDNVLFNYILTAIGNDVGNLADKEQRTTINIIKWCIKKGLIQQAVTIYSEQIPKEFIEQQIIYYNKENWDKEDEEQSNESKEPIYKNWIQNCLVYDEVYYSNQNSINKRKKSVYSEETNFFNKCLTRKGRWKSNPNADRLIIVGEAYHSAEKFEELKRNVFNYKDFKETVRNKIQHMDFKSGKVRTLGDISLKDKSIKDKLISVDSISELILDLVGQLEDLGMK